MCLTSLTGFFRLYLNHNTFLASDYLCFGDSSLFKFSSLEHFSLGQIHAKLTLNLNKYLENPLSRTKPEFFLAAVTCEATKREPKPESEGYQNLFENIIINAYRLRRNRFPRLYFACDRVTSSSSNWRKLLVFCHSFFFFFKLSP